MHRLGLAVLVAWCGAVPSVYPTSVLARESPPPAAVPPDGAVEGESTAVAPPAAPAEPTASGEPAPAGAPTEDVAPAVVDEPAAPAQPVTSAWDDEKPGPARSLPPPESAPESAPEGFRRPGHYLHVAPGILAFNVLDPRFRFYAWGVSGGRSVVRGKRFAAQLGGFFEHLVGSRDPAVDLLRLGGEFRLGASGERVFGYALVRPALDVAVIPNDVFSAPGRRAALFFLLTLGAGVQGALGRNRRLIVGVEPGFDFTWPGVLILFRTRAFIGWRFG
jgi:hypothetical protein